MRSWREKVDPIIKNYLEAQVKETLQYKDSYNVAKDKGKAQLWIAVANLSKQIMSVEMKTKYIENVLKDMMVKLSELKGQKPKEEKEPDKAKTTRKITKKKTKKK